MVMTSGQIAEMNGGFQQMGMMQMQNAAMVGAFAGPGNPGFGENVMGRAANIGSSIGAPLAMGGLALAGMDPISAGLRGGMAGFARGGMMGAAAGGLGAAAAVGAPLMAAQYAMGQFMHGMQERQQFNQQMRQSFHFFNPNARSGQGFSQAQLGTIGTDMRQMAGGQVGGQSIGFEELGRLASNMGRMGMDQGVRDAKEFTDKFKTMVRSLKEIATQMGTSLEEAQKMMSGMRSSGVFGAGQQAQFAGMIRQGAQSGNLATTELTGMMSVGSQISRMIGGRGRAGAQAGIESITNIGTALQTGTLSEEDIYNTTGLTGAEGRRAMATNMLQGSAKFLKSRLGRRVVAAMAGKDGSLNEDAVEEFMSGGVGTGRTMELAHKNLGKVGRANFIRNEGRIRGEIMGRFGGLMPAMAMRGWLEQRGMDVDEDSDRSMIFMQRRLGMGRDEADMMVRMAQQLPQLMEKRRESAREGEIFGRIQKERATTGISGLKRRLEKARSDVQNSLREAGDNFMQEGSDLIEQFVNQLSDRYTQKYHKDIMTTFRAGGGAGATAEGARLTTTGRLEGVGDATQRRFDVAAGDIYGRQQRRGMTLDRFRAGTFEQQEGFFGGMYSALSGGQSLEGQYRDAGYGKLMTATSDRELQSQIRGVQNTAAAYRRGLGAVEGKNVLAGRKMSDELTEMFAGGQIRGQGLDRIRSFQRALESAAESNPEMKELAARFRGAPTTRQAQMMGEIIAGAGVQGQAQLVTDPGAESPFGRGRFRTEEQRLKAIGRSFYSRAGSTVDEVNREEAGMLGGGIAGILTLGGLIGGDEGFKSMQQRASGMLEGLYGDEEASLRSPRALAQIMEGEEFQGLGQRLLGGGMGGRAARREITGKVAALQAAKDKRKTDKSAFTASDQAELDAMQSLLMAQDLSNLDKEFKGGRIPGTKQRELEKKYPGMSFKDIVNRASVAGGYLSQTERDRNAETIRQVREEGRTTLEAMQGRGGLLQMDEETGELKLSADVATKLKKMGGKDSAAGRFMDAALDRTKIEGSLGGTDATLREDSKKLYDSNARSEKMTAALEEMTVAEKRKLLDAHRGVAGASGIRRRIQSSLNVHQRVTKLGRGAQGAAGLAEMLGIDVGDEGKADIAAALRGEGGADAAAESILSAGGVKLGGTAQKDLTEALVAQQKGESGKVAELLRSLMSNNPELKEAQEKRKEAADKERNPTLAKAEGHLNEIKSSLSKLTPGAIGSAVGDAVAEKLPKSGEDKGGIFG